MPAWRQGQAVNEWRRIPGSQLSRAPMQVKTYPTVGNTGPQSKVIAWCGFAIDTRTSTLYAPAGGGHFDYAGNEVNSVRLEDDAPAWTERRAATPVSQLRTNSNYYADGRPTSRHSYYGVAVNEQRNRVMLFTGALWGDGRHTTATDGFDISRDDWDSAGTYPNVPRAGTLLYGAAFVENKATGDVYMFGNYSVYRWTNASNAWTQLAGSTSIYGFEAASAYDSRRNRILVVGGLNNDRYLFNVANNTTQAVSFSGSAASSLSGNGMGMVYDPLIDAFLVRKGSSGNTVYRIDAATMAVTTLSTTGGTVPGTQHSVYRKFLYVPRLKGVVYGPEYAGELWFLRTA